MRPLGLIYKQMLLIKHTQNNDECYNARKACTTANESINKTCNITDHIHACGLTENNRDDDEEADSCNEYCRDSVNS